MEKRSTFDAWEQNQEVNQLRHFSRKSWFMFLWSNSGFFLFCFAFNRISVDNSVFRLSNVLHVKIYHCKRVVCTRKGGFLTVIYGNLSYSLHLLIMKFDVSCAEWCLGKNYPKAIHFPDFFWNFPWKKISGGCIQSRASLEGVWEVGPHIWLDITT